MESSERPNENPADGKEEARGTKRERGPGRSGFDGFFGNLAHHGRIFFSAWRDETLRRKTNTVRPIETDFLPAALEIMERPPSPLGRAILWTIILLTLVTLAWAFWGRVDVVAVAEGRIISRERLKTVETAEAGLVTAIHVAEGDSVQAGTPLLALDPTYADADAGTAQADLSAAVLARARARALLAYTDGDPLAFDAPDTVPEEAAQAEAEVVASRAAAFDARRASLTQRREAALAEAEAARQAILKFSELIPLLQQRIAARQDLVEKGLSPRLQLLDLEEQRIAVMRDKKTRQAERKQALAQAAMIEGELEEAQKDFRARAAAELAEAEATVAARSEGLRKARTRAARQIIMAPVDGTIHEIALTTIGEMAQPGEPLMTIVPAGDELIVEAQLLNKDVGFVKIDQDATIKLEAYPFTRYGFLAGKVEHISPDAIADERRGFVFPARIALKTTTLSIGDRVAVLSPGMSATVEVVTGSRRVIDFLLSPIARATREAGRER